MSAHLQSFSKRPIDDRGQPRAMRDLLHAIHTAKAEYAGLPFFLFLRDEALSPRERLAFVPCMAPFIMDFGDLNRYVLRDTSSDDPYQRLVNEHTFEDDHHWPWYLDDVAALGHDQVRCTTDVLRALYDDRMAVNRLLAWKLTHLVADASPIERLVVIEAIEETGNVLFTHTAALARRVERREGIELRYLGDFHLTLESGHARTNDDGTSLEAVVLDDEARVRCHRLVAQVFALFAEWVAELHAYAIAPDAASHAA
jgi:hypothetical protein